jgi:hypothetical protein
MMAMNFWLVLWEKNLEEKINSKRSFNKFQASFGSEITLLLLLMFLLDTLVNGEFGSLEEEQKKVRDVQKLKQ